MIINFTGAGNTFTLDTFDNLGAGHTTYGQYLDTTGKFAVSASEIQGLLVGGTGSTFAGSTIFATPEPSSFAIAAIGVLALAGWRALQLRKGKLA